MIFCAFPLCDLLVVYLISSSFRQVMYSSISSFRQVNPEGAQPELLGAGMALGVRQGSQVGTLHHNQVQYWTGRCSEVQCSALMQCSVLYCSAVQ